MNIVDYLEQMWDLAATGKAQGVFFWFSLYAFVMLLYSFFYQIRVAKWPSTKGELIDISVREFGFSFAPSQKRYVAVAAYKYVVDGREYIGKRLSPWLFMTNNNASLILKNQINSIFHHSDGAVTVYYNLRNPNKCYLIKPGLYGKLITVLLAVTPFLFYWLLYYD